MPHPFLIILEANANLTFSLCPKLEAWTWRRSTYHSTSNTLVLFPTTKVRLASSSPGSPLGSTFSTISETTNPGFSVNTHTWLREPLMAPVWRFCSSSRLLFSALVELRTRSPLGGETTRMETMIGVLWQSKRSDLNDHEFESGEKTGPRSVNGAVADRMVYNHM